MDYYPWYKFVENTDELQQGDFIPNCPILKPPLSFRPEEEIEVEIDLIDSIVLSQSCDLANGKINIVLVSPYTSLKTFIEGIQISNSKEQRKTIENLRKGYLPGYHLLNKCNGYFEDYQVVYFQDVYGIQIESLKNICCSIQKRIRLNPPYREHLSQSFARYFMRVGLPQDIIIEGY
jgi:hypothetical protein